MQAISEWRDARLDQPRAVDAPLATASGPDPDRVLLLGGGAVAGLGVTRHADGLTGRLARGLASRTGRGAVVEAIGEPGASLAEVGALVPPHRLARTDAVVLVAGMVEALGGTSRAAWRRALEQLLDRLETDAARGPEVVVATIPPPSRIGPVTGRAGRAADRRARALARITARVVAARTRCHLVELDGRTAATAAPTAAGYQMWSEQIAIVLTPVLDRAVGLLPGHTARSAPDPEPERQGALARTGLRREASTGLFSDLVRRAHDLLGGDVAAVGFIDADTHWFTAAHGGDAEALPRAISLCDHTIRGGSGLSVGDLTGDPRFERNPLVTDGPRLRFYAGYPIESPDGYRIGSICVLSSTPRDPASVDVSALQELAWEARARLAAGEVTAG